MFGKLCGFVVISMVTLGAFACGGLSEEEIKLRCDQEKAAKPQIFTEESYKQCLTCYEFCGDECIPISSTPATYECASADTGAGGSGTGGTGGTGGGK